MNTNQETSKPRNPIHVGAVKAGLNRTRVVQNKRRKQKGGRSGARRSAINGSLRE